MKTKHYIYILTTIFILSLIPLYIIGKYNHPSVDDYYYGVETSATWNATGSIVEVFILPLPKCEIPITIGKAILQLYF